MKAQGEAFLGNTTVWGEKINKTVLWTFTRSGSGWIYLTIEKNVPQIYKMRACQQEKAHDLRYFHMLGRQADCCSSFGLSSFNSQLLHLQISLVSTQASSHAPLFHFFLQNIAANSLTHAVLGWCAAQICPPDYENPSWHHETHLGHHQKWVGKVSTGVCAHLNLLQHFAVECQLISFWPGKLP